MTTKPWMSTSLLVAAVTWGGVACACGTASLAVEPASVHAAHHGDGEAPGPADCERLDCNGDCAAEGILPERALALAEPPAMSPDDGVAAPAIVFPAQRAPPGSRSYAPAVWKPSRAADTPVRRFDLLLN